MAEVRELSYAECRALLIRGQLGRVAIATPDGPHIVPLNYSVVDESIIFRTTPFSVLATHARNANVAFEVDSFREGARAGWSVVARGRADAVLDQDELSHIRQVWPPDPWADGPRHLHFRLSWRELTGRSLGRAAQLDLTDEGTTAYR